jgi:hypothetical protein
MLISMPHGTSTIFGVFQAILALLANGTNFRPRKFKLPRDEKFASEFFRLEASTCFAATQQCVPTPVDGPIKAKGDQGVHSRSLRGTSGMALGLPTSPK